MNCIHCEEKMSDYLEGALNSQERALMDAHLHECSACTELMSGMREVLSWAHAFPSYEAPAWLPEKILANTPRIARESWSDTVASVWKWISEPRTAMAVFTATIMLGWLGSMAGVSGEWATVVRNPASIYYGAQGAVNRAYDEAIRKYYRSPFVSEIRTRIEQLREIS